MARQLYIDTDSGRFVEGVNSSLTISVENLFNGDNVPYELYFLKASTTGNAIFDPVDNSAASVNFAIGPNPPSAASAYASQNTWTNISSAVTGTIARTITGSSSTNEQQTLTFAPEAFDGTFSISIPSRAVTLSSISAGVFTSSGNHGLALLEPFVVTGATTPSGFTNGQTLYVSTIGSTQTFYANSFITASAYVAYGAAAAGSIYTITASSAAIPARASAELVQGYVQAIRSVGSGNVNVTGSVGKLYRMSFQNAKQQTQLGLATVAGTLTPIYGKTATISFGTTSLLNAISASASIDATVEVQITNGTEITTVLQKPVVINKDIIS
jgi:hypothetical protein